MSQLFLATLPNIVFPVNVAAGDSNVLDLKALGFDAEAYTIVAPTTITDANTITMLGSVDKGVTYQTICDSTNTAIAPPGAAKLITYNGILTALTNLKFHASGAVTAVTTFQIMKAWRA